MRIEANEFGDERAVVINTNLATILVKLLNDAETNSELAERYGICAEDLISVPSLAYNIEKANNDKLIHLSWSVYDVLSLYITNPKEVEENDEAPIYSITLDEAKRKLLEAKKYHDGNYGITWDTFKNI